jgi:hypothetical protein
MIVIGAIGASVGGLNSLLQRPSFLTTMFTYLHDNIEMKACVLSAVTEIFEKRYVVFNVALRVIIL